MYRTTRKRSVECGSNSPSSSILVCSPAFFISVKTRTFFFVRGMTNYVSPLLLDRDLLEATEIHYSSNGRLWVTFPEEFHRMTNPPLPNSKIYLFHNDSARNALNNMTAVFSNNLGKASQYAIDFLNKHGFFRIFRNSGTAYFDFQYYQIYFHIQRDGYLVLKFGFYLSKIIEMNAPEFIDDVFKDFVLNYGDGNVFTGYQRLVKHWFVPHTMELQRREDAGLGLEMNFGLRGINEDVAFVPPLVLSNYVPGERIYTFQSRFKYLPFHLSNNAFVNIIFANAPESRRILNAYYEDGVFFVEWNRCSIKIYQEEKVIEVTLLVIHVTAFRCSHW